MSERRSGVDLLYCEGGWAVVYGSRLLGTYATRDEAVGAARQEGTRIRAERQLTGAVADPETYARLRSRRHPRHQHSQPPVGIEHE